MATFNSFQLNKATPSPAVSKNTPRDYYGRKRIAHGSFVVGTDGGGAAIPSGTIINLFNLPPSARITGGKIVTSGAGTSATASVGLVNGGGNTAGGGTGTAPGTGTEFCSAGSVASAGKIDLAQTIATGYGYGIIDPAAAALAQANNANLPGDTVILTTGGATYTSGTIIEVELEFEVD